MTTDERIALCLEACEGLSDEELRELSLEEFTFADALEELDEFYGDLEVYPIQ